MSKSTVNNCSRKPKPKKPYPTYPLFAHASGKWCKTIRGKMYYFGQWDDPQGALDEYLDVADDLHAGRQPREKSGFDVAFVCSRFIEAKESDKDAGKLSPRTYVDYDRTCRLLVAEFGRERAVADLGPKDFERLHTKLSRKHNLQTFGKQITMVRSIFKYAFEMEYIDKPVRFGPRFKAPSKTDKRKAKQRDKQQKGNRVFEPHEVQTLLELADPQLKAMILLAANAGFGNSDCAMLPISAIDFQKKTIDYPRPKTGVERIVPMWDETAEALQQVINNRKQAKNPADGNLVFLTRCGQPWVRYDIVETNRAGRAGIKPRQCDAIATAFSKLLKVAGFNGRGLSFYRLRHTFETVGSGARDQVALDNIMGHADSSMSAQYRAYVELERLQRITNHVHNWLFCKQD